MPPRAWSLFLFTLPSFTCWPCSLAGSPCGPKIAAMALGIVAKCAKKRSFSVCMHVHVCGVRNLSCEPPANIHWCLSQPGMCDMSKAEPDVGRR
jgi:hypothetical protein